MKYVYIFLLVFIFGCYTEKKARQQFDKAATSFPKIPAEFCADEFPVRDSTVRDTLFTTDTIFLEQLSDTVMVQDFDTVRVTITKTLPAKIITNTVHITDTIIRENTAALRLCEIDKSSLTDLLVKKTNEADKYKGQAKKRGFIMWGLVFLLIAIIGLQVYLKSKKVVK